MKLVLDELGMTTLVTEPMNNVEFTLLRFPYTTFLCSLSENNDITDRILKYQSISDAKSIKDIKEAASKLIKDQIDFPSHFMSTAISYLFCEEWFGEGKLRLADRYFDSTTSLIFYHSSQKDGFIPIPGTASEQIHQGSQNPTMCYFQYDHITNHLFCKIGGFENFVIDAPIEKISQMVINKIEKILLRFPNDISPKNKDNGRGKRK